MSAETKRTLPSLGEMGINLWSLLNLPQTHPGLFEWSDPDGAQTCRVVVEKGQEIHWQFQFFDSHGFDVNLHLHRGCGGDLNLGCIEKLSGMPLAIRVWRPTREKNYLCHL